MFDKLNKILFIAIAHPDESVKDRALEQLHGVLSEIAERHAKSKIEDVLWLLKQRLGDLELSQIRLGDRSLDELVKDKGLAIKKAKKVFSYRPELRMPKKLLRLKNDY